MSAMRIPVRDSSSSTNAETPNRRSRTATYSSRRCFRSAATDAASRQGSSVCFDDLRCTADMAKHVAAPQTATVVPRPGPSTRNLWIRPAPWELPSSMASVAMRESQRAVAHEAAAMPPHRRLSFSSVRFRTRNMATTSRIADFMIPPIFCAGMLALYRLEP